MRKKKALLVIILLMFVFMEINIVNSPQQQAYALVKTITKMSDWTGVNSFYSDPAGDAGSGQGQPDDVIGMGIINDSNSLYIRWDVILGSSNLSGHYQIGFAPVTGDATNASTNLKLDVFLDKGAADSKAGLTAFYLNTSNVPTSANIPSPASYVTVNNAGGPVGSVANIMLAIPFSTIQGLSGISEASKLSSTSKRYVWGGTPTNSLNLNAGYKDVVPNGGGTSNKNVLDYDTETGQSTPVMTTEPLISMSAVANNPIVLKNSTVNYTVKISNLGATASASSIDWTAGYNNSTGSATSGYFTYNSLGANGTISGATITSSGSSCTVTSPVSLPANSAQTLNLVFNVTSSAAAGDYCNRITVNVSGNTYDSGLTALTTVKADAGNQPTINSTGSTTSSVSLDWSVVSGATSYNIYLDGIKIANTTSTSFSINQLASNTAYGITVTALSASGESISSAIKFIKTKSDLSPACDLTAVNTPTGTTISGTTATASVVNSTDTVTVDATISTGATWKLYSDAGCTSEITDKTVDLAVGLNTVYVKVTAADTTTSQIYTLNITRAASTACDLTSVSTPSGTTISGTTATASVANSTDTVTVDAAVSVGATWKLYSDAGCTSEITDKTVDLAVGLNTVYVKVTAEDTTTSQIYTLNITREAAAASTECDLTSVSTPSGTTISGTTATANVANSTDTVTVDTTVSTGATWKLYSDAGCTSEITDKTVNPAVGLNTVYIKVTAEDTTTSQTYTLNITRAAAATSIECDLTSVSTPSGTTISGTTATASVVNSTDTVTVDAAVSAGATWKLYSDAGCTSEITDKTVDLAVGTNTVYVKVTAEDTTTSQIYTLNITRAAAAASTECDLTSVITPTGTMISGTTATANVTNSTDSITVDATVSTGATWKLYSDAGCTSEITDKTVDLSVGVNTVYVKVTAEDTTTSQIYTLNITRAAAAAATDCELVSVVIPSGTTISGMTATANVANSADTVTVDATVSTGATWKLYSDAGCTSEITDKTVDLAVGTNTVYVKVTAEDTTTSQIYTLNITRAAAAASTECDLTSVGTPSGTTISGTTATASVANSTDTVTVDASVSAGATWKLYSDAGCTSELTDKTVDLSVGANPIYIKVTAEDTTTSQIYTLNITREAAAASTACELTSVGTPSGTTISGTTATANVANSTDTVTVDTTVSAGATWKLYSDAGCTSEITDETVDLSVGVNTVYIKVTAEDATTSQIYTLNITRAAAAASTACELTSVITPSGTTISGTTATANVANSTDTVTVAAIVSAGATWKLYSDAGCTSEITDKTVDLSVGVNTVYVKVTAEDTTTSQIYTLNITREAAAASTACELTSVIAPSGTTISGTTATASAVNSTDTVTVDATVSAGATWKLYSDAGCTSEITDKTVDLAVGLNTVYIKVTAEDTTTTNTYTLNITRAAAAASTECDLTSVIAPGGTTISGTIATASVANSTDTVTVDATVSAGATWKLYSDAGCTSEITDKTVDLAVGLNTVYIKVTAEDTTTTNTYTLNITREAAAASTECDLTSVIAPGGTTISGTTATADVTNSTDTVTVDASVSAGATWKLYSDAGCTSEITDKTVDLGVGANTIYIKVTAEDTTTSQIYTLNITREAAAASTACELTSVIAPSGTTISGITATASVANSTDTVTVAATVSAGATWKLYSDAGCTTEITDKTVDLAVGLNTVYIKVTAEDTTTTKTYTLNITRAAAAVIPAVTPTVSGPANVSKYVGDTATYSVTAHVTDGGVLSYQWQKYNGTIWVNLTGKTAATYTTDTLSISDNGSRYRCVVTNTKGLSTAVSTSAEANLTVTQQIIPPVIIVPVIPVSTDAVNDKDAVEIITNSGDSYGHITTSITLPTVGQSGNTTISWTSSNPGVISNTGSVTRPEPDQDNANVSLTAVITDKNTGVTTTKSFELTVVKLSDEDAVADAARNLTIAKAFRFEPGDTWEAITKPFLAVSTGDHGTTISWNSSGSTISLSAGSSGYNASVTRPTADNINVILTALVSRGKVSVTKSFLLVVEKDGNDKAVTRETTTRSAVAEIAGASSTQNFTVERTVLEDNTYIDYVKLDDAKMKTLADSAASEGDTSVSIVVPSDPEKRAQQTAIEIPALSIAALDDKNSSLYIDTADASIRFEKDAIHEISDKGTDLFFRIVPINDSKGRTEANSAASRNSAVINFVSGNTLLTLGTPVTIETNYQDFETYITLPFTGITLPDKDLDKFMDTLRIFVEHSDGTTEFLTPTIVYKNGTPYGAEFRITKFSRFQIISYSNVQDATTNNEVVEAEKFDTKPVLTAGDSVGSTSVIVNKSDAGNNIVIWVTSEKVQTPDTGDLAPEGKGVINPYQSGSDIDGIDTSKNKYIAIYETNKDNEIIKFDQIKVTESKIKKCSKIILATELDYSDHIAGSLLADKDTIILRTDKTKESVAKVVSYIVKNLDKNGTIYILGGTTAIPEAIVKKIKAKGFKNIIRIGGADKYDTAALIADFTNVPAGTPVLLTSGELEYHLLLDAAGISGGKGYPILYTTKSTLTESTKQELLKLKPKKIYLVGDKASINKSVIKELMSLLKLKSSDIIWIKTKSDLKKMK